MLIPPALSPRSKIRIVAPSGPFDRTLFWRGVGWLSQHFRVHFERSIFEKDGFLAGTDTRRRTELQAAFDDDDACAIVVARGGWGAARFVSALDFTGITRAPKWFVGFSDPTILHWQLGRLGVASMHAANLVTLGREDHDLRESWLQALLVPLKHRILRGVSAGSGAVTGVLVGGNLTVLVSGLCTGGLQLPPRCVLVLEDVAESSYRIDRMISALVASGSLDRIGAVALGEFVDCDAGVHRVSVERVLRNHFEPMGIPVVLNLPFGHGRRNAPLPLGTHATLDASRGELRLGIE